MENIRPTGKRILVERDKQPTTHNGILLPGNDLKKNTGTVKAWGKECKEVNTGDRVIFNPYAGAEYTENLLIMSEDDVLAVLKE